MAVYGDLRTSLALSGLTGGLQGLQVNKFMILINLNLQVSGQFNGDLQQNAHLTPADIIQQGDDGITLQITVLDDQGVPVDLSAATNLYIFLLKPDLAYDPEHPELNELPAILETNGRDGRMSTPLAPEDLQQAGYYRVQGHFTIAGQEKHTFRGVFVVKPNLPDTNVESTVFVNQEPV